MGRPTNLTEEIANVVVRVLREGANRRIAAAAAAVSERTLYRWLRRGDDGEEPYSTFCQNVKIAEADATAKCLKTIFTASDNGVWQAAAWWLERRWPEEWGNNRAEINKLLQELVGEKRRRSRESAAKAEASEEAEKPK